LVLRFLRKRKIAFFPIAGVALGVMALVVVLSIMQGFETDFRERIRSLSPDISLDFKSVNGFTGDTGQLLEKLAALAPVRAVSPYISGQGLAEVKTPVPDKPLEQYVYDGYVTFKGFEFGPEQEVMNLAAYLETGEDFFGAHPYSADGGTRPAFILGARFAGKKFPDTRTKETDWGNVGPGAPVQVSTLTVDNDVARLVGTVEDIVASGIWGLDEHLLFMPLDWARALRRLPAGSITGVGMALEDYDEKSVALARKEITALMRELAPYDPFTLTTWEEQRGTFLTAVAMERRIMAFILFFFLVVAGFSISAILIMIVLEKVRDIGILRAMGASSGGIAATFLTYGVTIGILGAALGLGAGVAFVRNLDWIEATIYNLTGWQPFPPQVYDLPAIPRILNWVTNFAVVGTAVFVSFLASVIPAVRAAWLDPVEAIRYE
jgi:lipoprotein-releasing system permease protein